jgi:hypothetical protein
MKKVEKKRSAKFSINNETNMNSSVAKNQSYDGADNRRLGSTKSNFDMSNMVTNENYYNPYDIEFSMQVAKKPIIQKQIRTDTKFFNHKL